MTSRNDARRAGAGSGLRRAVASGLVAGLLALTAVACDRTYLTPTHGRAYREAFAVQTVNPNRKNDSRAVNGLDSQEAAIVSSTYRKGLAPSANDAAAAQTQMLTYSRTGGREVGPPAASSVPGGM